MAVLVDPKESLKIMDLFFLRVLASRWGFPTPPPQWFSIKKKAFSSLMVRSKLAWVHPRWTAWKVKESARVTSWVPDLFGWGKKRRNQRINVTGLKWILWLVIIFGCSTFFGGIFNQNSTVKTSPGAKKSIRWFCSPQGGEKSKPKNLPKNYFGILWLSN